MSIVAWYWCPTTRALYSGPIPGPRACTVAPTTEVTTSCGCGHGVDRHVTNLQVVRCVECMNEAVKTETAVEQREPERVTA